MKKNKLDKWNPLEKSKSSTFYDATVKNGIKNILKSYMGYYDPFSEMIQNALDAIDKRRMSEKNFVGKIWVIINLKDKIITVIDNGIGLTRDEIENFLAPNVTFKEKGMRGNKGVGLTYLAYGFNFLQIGTKIPGFQFIGNIEKSREWIEDDSNKIAVPLVVQSKLIQNEFLKIDRGSIFTLKLSGNFIRPKDLDWVGANTAAQWEFILKVKTPLGGIYFSKKSKYINPDCTIKIIDEKGKITQKHHIECEYLYPHKIISACESLNNIISTQERLLKKGKDIDLPDKYKQLNAIYNFWKKDEILSFEAFNLNENEKELVKKYSISVYAFFCYSTEIWDIINDQYAKLRKSRRILRGGLQIGTNSMPQGDLIDIPLTSNIGLQNATHVIVHFENADPDLGRKGFQSELVDVAKKLSADCVKIFIARRSLLRKQEGPPTDVIEEKELYDWINSQIEHEKREPLVIKREDLFLPMKKPAITSIPLNEQDVIALFNQFLAGGVIRGIRLVSSSQHKQYDGIFKFIWEKPLPNHFYDKKNNPLGVEKAKVQQEFTSKPDVLEYKYTFDYLIDEMETGDKTEKHMGLIVAWEMGNKWIRRYQITPLLHLDNLHHRQFHGITHIIKDFTTGDKVFYAIILSELIEFLNDFDKSQSTQKNTYMNDR